MYIYPIRPCHRKIHLMVFPPSEKSIGDVLKVPRGVTRQRSKSKIEKHKVDLFL